MMDGMMLFNKMMLASIIMDYGIIRKRAVNWMMAMKTENCRKLNGNSELVIGNGLITSCQILIQRGIMVINGVIIANQSMIESWMIMGNWFL